MMEGWSQFIDLLTHNVYFRAGFIWGLAVAVMAWAIFGMLNWLLAQWLKVRQFFEPTRRPGKIPVETGPSPATIMLGCLGRIVVTGIVVVGVLLVLWWWLLPGQ